jgi:ATP-binding cassette subfamily A (ABC1) protein 3
LPSYWIPSKKSQSNKKSDDSSKQNENYFEAEPTNTKVGITCQNLRKVFNKKTAVNDVSLNIFSGQITVLLGHIFPPSSGTAYVDGYDIKTQTKEARRSIALCPQENILYNELDVYQHLKLYAILKDHPWNDVDNEINKILQLVTLTDKKHSLSTQLSGGMKRKLSLGIAMIANSKILILDEPTSGMDPEARRHMWDVLQSIRRDKTILLTTHYMEEADVS